MNVICINDSWKPSPSAIDHRHPSFGQICSVTETFDFNGHEWFRLVGFGTDGFRTDMFCPVGGPCEVAMIEERYDHEVAELDKSFRDLVHEVENK